MTRAARAAAVPAPRVARRAPAAASTAPAAAWLAWAGWAHLRFTAVLAGLHAAWFCLIYGLADWLTGLHARRVHVHFEWELHIPFVPAATLVYMAIYGLFLLVPFVLRTRLEVLALTWSLAVTTFVSGVCFLLLPVELAYPPPPHDMGAWTPLFRLADALNLRFNLLPSLHVALTVVCVAALARGARPGIAAALWAWSGLVAWSTLLTHQHHVLDVLAGYAVALAAHHWVYMRLTVRGSAGGFPPYAEGTQRTRS